MPHARAVTLLALMALGGVTAVGCGLTDVFAPAGLKSIVVAYQGDTVVSPGATIPFTVAVRVDGALQPTPSLSTTSIDTAILVVTAGQDSLRGVANGFDTLTIRLVSSIFTDSVPTIRQAIRVRP